MREDEDGARSSRDKREERMVSRYQDRIATVHAEELPAPSRNLAILHVFSSVDEKIVYKRKAGDRKKETQGSENPTTHS